MMAVLELVDRPGQPLFHIEHYIGESMFFSSFVLFLLFFYFIFTCSVVYDNYLFEGAEGPL